MVSSATTPILQQVLQKFPRCDKIKFKNPEKLEGLLKKIIDATEHSLQVITDFDFTITRRHLNGKSCVSSYGVLDYSPLLSEAFRTKNLALCSKYRHIELSHELTREEKMPLMLEWYTQSHNALVEHGGLTRSILKEVISLDNNVHLRDNAAEFFEILDKAKIPTLIFSAGIGDILQGIIEREGCLHPNSKIVANWMDFDESGTLKGFKEPVIHSFCKNETVLGDDSSYFEELSHRPYAILLGDQIGDIQMSDGMPHQDGILRIAFLNEKIEETLESFMAAYDIVIVDDQSMDFVNLLLSFILKQTHLAE